MNIVGVIPARYASTRLPGKPLLLIKGKTMIERVYRQVQKSKLIDRVIVATDDKRIFDCVKNFGGEVKMTSVNHQSGTDRIFETVKNIKADIIVNIQGDEPFIDPLNIDKAIKPIITDKRVDVSTLAIRIKNVKDLMDINKVKVVLDMDNFALYFSRNAIPFEMKNEKLNENYFRKYIYYKHIGLYVYRKNFLMKFAGLKSSYLERIEKLEQLRILENGDRIKVVITKKDSYSVDTKNDLKFLNKL
ncbi:MAG TPA: 3-deoxy-manno-octulosonate cytidylyltransferase [Ignavibacteria bacterium]|nr:3-deoxy-manno-octulosonate cytidylyltransferase [Ignavibacteria bacterium]